MGRSLRRHWGTGAAWIYVRRCVEGKIALDVECSPFLGPLIRAMEAGQMPQHYIKEQQFTQENLAQEIIDGREH